MSALTWAQRWVARLDLATVAALDEALAPVLAKLELIMSATSELLDTVAEGLTTLATPIADLIAADAAKAARIAELENSDIVETEAAGRVKAAFDDLAGKLTAEPSVPDVAPLPEPEPAPVVETPAEPESQG